MKIAKTFNTSWELMQRALHVVRGNPRLALFPVVSTLCVILLAGFFFAPIAIAVVGLTGAHGWRPVQEWGDGAQEWKRAIDWAFYTYGAVIYLVSLFVATFFNVAFYHQIMRALAGDPVSVGGGLRFAMSRLRSILCWSLLAGTVGLIIRAIEERLGWLGKIGMALVGMAWSVAAVFAIPVIIRRGEANPFAVLKGSAVTLKQTWGESLVGFVGIKMAAAVLVFGAFVGAGVGVILTALSHSTAVAVAYGGCLLLAIWAAAFLLAMATHVYRCALYVYASEGVVPEPFTAEMMDAGWKVKKR